MEYEFEQLWLELYPEIDLVAQYCGIPGRKFRFDYACPETKVAVEINGGTYVLGRHSSGMGLRKEYEKLNLAQFHGWAVFVLDSTMIDEAWLFLIAECISLRR